MSLVLNIDTTGLQKQPSSEPNQQPNQYKNKDKYKKSKQKIIQKKQERQKKAQNQQGIQTQSKPLKKDFKPFVKSDKQPKPSNEEKSKEVKFIQRDPAKEYFKKKEIKPVQEEPKEEVKEAEAAQVFTVEKFEDLNINDKLKQVLNENEFKMMTNIQQKAIPIILNNPNVIVKSETGSGKTLAYLIPLLEHFSKLSLSGNKIKRENGTYCVIFSPTRELCVQIEMELKKLLKLFFYVVSGTIMGGENPQKEKARIRKGLTVIICTPGRFLYHLQNTSSMNLSHLNYLIFDEADRILDLGFEREMNQCLDYIKTKVPHKFKQPENKENFWSDQIKINFVSATLNQRVEKLGSKLMESYVQAGFDANVEDSDMKISMPKQVQQFYMEVPTQYRLVYLLSFLYAHKNEKIIVFISNCELVNFLWALLSNMDWNTLGQREDGDQVTDQVNKSILFGGHIYKLHGDMDHGERKKNFFGFDKADQAVLVCTDVASRGLDFKSVQWIVQYDLSSQIKEYVNRVGRTARISSGGSSICFVQPIEKEYASYLEKNHGIKMYRESRFEIMKQFGQVAEKEKELRYKILKNIEDSDERQEQVHSLRSLIKRTFASKDVNLVSLAKLARSSSSRAYAGHSHELRKIFDIKNLNLTEFARSFGLYKNIEQELYHGQDKKRSYKEREEEKEQIKGDQQQFTKRLLKAKQKEVQRKIYETQDFNEKEKLQGELKALKKQVFTDEKKVEQRTKNFKQAKSKTNVQKKMMNEFL